MWTYQSLAAMTIKEIVHDMRQKKVMASTGVYCLSCESLEGGRGGVFPVVGEGGWGGDGECFAEHFVTFIVNAGVLMSTLSAWMVRCFRWSFLSWTGGVFGLIDGLADKTDGGIGARSVAGWCDKYSNSELIKVAIVTNWHFSRFFHFYFIALTLVVIVRKSCSNTNLHSLIIHFAF